MFDLNGAKQAGYSDDEIASFLGSQYKFDVEKARVSGYSSKDIISFLSKRGGIPSPTKKQTVNVQPKQPSFYESLPAEIRAIPPTIAGTAKELATWIPGGKYIVSGEERKALTTSPVGAKEILEAQSQMTEQELLDLEMTGKWPERIPKPKTKIGSVAPEVQKGLEWAAAPGATKVVSGVVKKEIPWLSKFLNTRIFGKPKGQPIVSGVTAEEVAKPKGEWPVPELTEAEKAKIHGAIKKVTGKEPTASDIKIIEQEAKVAKMGEKIEPIAQEAKLEGMKPTVTSMESLEAQVKGGIGFVKKELLKDVKGDIDAARAQVISSTFEKYGNKSVTESKKIFGRDIEDLSLDQALDLGTRLETMVKGGMGIGGKELPKYVEGTAINLEKLNTTDEVKNLINTIASENKSAIGKRKVSWEETQKNAELLGWNVDDVRMVSKKQGGFSAAEIDAMRQVNLNTQERFRDTLANLPYDRAQRTPEMRASILDAIDMIRITSQASSEAGRALNIHKRILSRGPEYLERAKRVGDKKVNDLLGAITGKYSGRTDDIIDALKKIDLNNPAEVNQAIYSLTKSNWQKLSDSAYEVWMNMLLSNPMTHIINTTSNAAVLATQYPERKIASMVEKGLSKIQGRPQELFWNENNIQKFAHIKALQDATSKFSNLVRTGESTVSKMEERISALPKTWWGKTLTTPGRALQLEDEFYKVYIQSLELNRLAGRQALREGLKGQSAINRTTELLKSPTDSMLETAASKAKELTFQSDMGKIGRAVMRIRNEVPMMKYFIPFVRTPLNIARYGLERTPFNIPRIVIKASRGEMVGSELSEEIAKVIMGGMLGTTAYLLADQGYFTGGGPKDKVARDELYRTGWQPYALHIGNKYYSLERLEPVASIMGMSADMKELRDHMTEDEKTNVGSAIAGAIAKNFTNKTFTTGFAKVTDAISNPGQYLSDLIATTSATVVPAISGGVARAIDPEIRQARTVLERIKGRIPGVSQSVPKRLTVWGEPTERPRGTPFGVPEQVMRFVSPIQVSEAKGYLIDKELVRLKLNVGMPTRKIKGVELNDEQYANLVKISGSKSLHQLNQLVQSDYYKKLDDEQKSKLISNIINKNRDYARKVLSQGGE